MAASVAHSAAFCFTCIPYTSGSSSRTYAGLKDSLSTSPKRGAVGEQRLKENAIPGTYWADETELGASVSVKFHTGGSNIVTADARAGENLLRVAERCGVIIPDRDFCFEGTCCHCEVDVVGGAKEVGSRGDIDGSNLVRSCICPIPTGQSVLEVNLIGDEDIWSEGVL